ncbi:MAG: type 1 glutamine amidotransferase, partial [bacterium]|nr:type 1 glutamine amidotransferase [bacterium]
YPWLAAEKNFIREVLTTKIPVLAICLGAQLIAAALGAEVRQSPEKEIGWFPVQIDLLSAANPLLAGLPATIIPLHWHGETFDLPPGARPFASSPACKNQGFTIDNRVLAMQFHLEFTKLCLDLLMEHCPEDLAPGPWVQTIEEISGAQENFLTANRLMGSLLSRLFPKNR